LDDQPPSQHVLLDKGNGKLPVFSYYMSPISNTKPYKSINVLDAYKLIKGDTSLKASQRLRQIDDKAKARTYKANQFDYVCFSGIFTKRSDQDLKQHSGLIVLDFDHLWDVDGVKRVLLADECLETVLLFRYPSGDGLKWVISIDISLMDQKNYFKAISNYLKATYQLEVDGSGKDVARACFLPHDHDVFINLQFLKANKLDPNAWLMAKDKPSTLQRISPPAQSTCITTCVDDDFTVLVDCLTMEVESKQIDLTQGYENWRNIAFALLILLVNQDVIIFIELVVSILTTTVRNVINNTQTV